jgi:hypothetical protein
LKARRFLSIVAPAIALTVASAPAAVAPSERVAVVVVPASEAVFRSPEAAHGLLVVGEGATVSRRGALASLLRGEMGNAIVDEGVPGGKQLISLSPRPARTTLFVALPPPGRHHNIDRYPIAVRGPGYAGLLTDTSTRLPGLISIADVAHSVRALREGERPRIRSHDEADPLGRLARFDRRLDRAHDSRTGATIVLVVLMLALSLLALVTRSAAAARAAFLAPPACVAAAVTASTAGISRPSQAVTALALAATAAAVAGGLYLRPRLPLAIALAAFFVLLFAVMWAKPEWNALAVIGPHPDGGGRFYGVTNQVETLLLPAVLVLGALAGRWLVPVALFGAAGIAASRVGADGGGLVVYLTGFLVLWLRLRRLPAPRAVAAVGAAAAVALLLVGVDAATGGSSHVTHAVGGGPGSVLGDLGHRLHLSAAALGSSWHAALLFALGIAALVVLALQRPRSALLDAYLVALGVSLLVNDTPVDVAGYGGLAALGLWLFVRSEETAERLQ